MTIRNHESPFGRDIQIAVSPKICQQPTKFDIMPDIGRPTPRRIESFGTMGKNLVFSLQTHDLLEKPGISPQVTGKPGVCIRTREISRVQKVRVYLSI